jgi:hypothetical protein
MSAQLASFGTTDEGFSAPKSYVAFGTFAGFDPSCQVDDDCPACGQRHISPEGSFEFDDACDVEQAEAA